MPDTPVRPFRAGDELDDRCAACKAVRRHKVIAAAAPGAPLRVVCGFCGSQHNYRGRIEEGERAPMTFPTPEAPGSDLAVLLRRILREEGGWTPTAPAEKWRGGEIVFRPGKPGLQEKSLPIDTFFHKVVMVRNRLRVLEQQLNGLDVPEDVKIKMQAYITACYGSLTSFNILFADEADRFHGAGE